MARKWWWFMLVGAVLLALGSAAGVSLLLRRDTTAGWQTGRMMSGPIGRGMPYGGVLYSNRQAGQRITLEKALTLTNQYAARYGVNYRVAEVMEFSDNFYAAITEVDTGRGAFEVLIDLNSGAIGSEPGPNMMWNLKYGHMMMSRTQAGDNTLTMEQARVLAQQTLDKSLPGAQAEATGRAFYGYYTFDYQVNGKIAGMLSVNGTTGDTWLHTWHGTFIDEKGMDE